MESDELGFMWSGTGFFRKIGSAVDWRLLTVPGVHAGDSDDSATGWVFVLRTVLFLVYMDRSMDIGVCGLSC